MTPADQNPDPDETGQDLNPGPLQDQDAVLRLMSLCL